MLKPNVLSFAEERKLKVAFYTAATQATHQSFVNSMKNRFPALDITFLHRNSPELIPLDSNTYVKLASLARNGVFIDDHLNFVLANEQDLKSTAFFALPFCAEFYQNKSQISREDAESLALELSLKGVTHEQGLLAKVKRHFETNGFVPTKVPKVPQKIPT